MKRDEFLEKYGEQTLSASQVKENLCDILDENNIFYFFIPQKIIIYIHFNDCIVYTCPLYFSIDTEINNVFNEFCLCQKIAKEDLMGKIENTINQSIIWYSRFKQLIIQGENPIRKPSFDYLQMSISDIIHLQTYYEILKGGIEL